MKKRRFFVTFFVALVLFGGIFYFFNNEILNLIGGQGNIEKDTISFSDDNEIMFLLTGIDTFDIADAKGERTDTMILSKVNFDTGDVDLVSIPRDTRVLVNGDYDKINHAHAKGGMDLTMNTVRDFLDIDLQYYVRMDYRAVEEIVNAIGGVDIYVPQRMKYDDTTAGKEFHVDLEEGQQVLNGNQAIQFLRWRKNNDGPGYLEGDVGRIKAQQSFMKELIKQSLKPKNILKVPKFIGIYNNYIDTNIPLNIVVKGVWSARKIDFDNINTQTIPGEGDYIGKVSYFLYDEEPTKELINNIFGKHKR